ncbi:hypothetical protein KQ306_03850 [Synechococcus sp. CS-1324]|uniref:hypothetical protein n=1 Tax=Synechococcus sp. CS-1324 TaxID=2847980 RepID=UPI000DB099D1|nr:hypothetical protein [Synechococcus sp. CS-1324]MCT0229997.1 hypothetical protein [Synechococcus sp. CS-1324]PZV05570.1 MAG: hypothetical protein DCF23_02820 [Cyanobium sp.]
MADDLVQSIVGLMAVSAPVPDACIPERCWCGSAFDRSARRSRQPGGAEGHTGHDHQVGAAFSWSRRLRKRMSTAKTTQLS